ncbi:MAG: exosome complex exonuclease Rrp41 [Nitrososphaerales archaeon]
MGKLINEQGIRADGRKMDELRPVTIEVGVVKNADGSAYIEFGRNKIMAAVYGPKEVHPKHMAQSDRGVLRCRYHMAPFSVDERKNPAPSRREIEISKVSREALEPALILQDYPRTLIDVYIEILQADGGSRCAGIDAAAVALADAGINMRDMVAACAAGKVDDTIVLDINDDEDKEGQADMPIAYLPNLGQVSLMQVDGTLSQEEYKKCLDMAIGGCMKVYQLQKDALMKKYFGGEVEVAAGGGDS